MISRNRPSRNLIIRTFSHSTAPMSHSYKSFYNNNQNDELLGLDRTVCYLRPCIHYRHLPLMPRKLHTGQGTDLFKAPIRKRAFVIRVAGIMGAVQGSRFNTLGTTLTTFTFTIPKYKSNCTAISTAFPVTFYPLQHVDPAYRSPRSGASVRMRCITSRISSPGERLLASTYPISCHVYWNCHFQRG